MPADLTRAVEAAAKAAWGAGAYNLCPWEDLTNADRERLCAEQRAAIAAYLAHEDVREAHWDAYRNGGREAALLAITPGSEP